MGRAQDIILACDTSQQACSVALALGDGTVLGDDRVIGRGHAEILPDMVAAMLAQGGVTADAVSRFGVTLGPGTFAGVRVGLAAMRAMALVARYKNKAAGVYGVGALEVLAAGLAAQDNPDGLPIGVAVDARRGRFYCQSFTGAGAAENEAAVLTPQDFIAAHEQRKMIILGTGGAVLQEKFAVPKNWQIFDAPLYPKAKNIIPLVAAMPPRDANAPPPAPLYLRPPDAVRPR